MYKVVVGVIVALLTLVESGKIENLNFWKQLFPDFSLIIIFFFVSSDKWTKGIKIKLTSD